MRINANSSFAWNDGKSLFNVRQPHLFALKGTRGVAVGKNSPNHNAALTVGGALRIQFDENRNRPLGTGLICDTNLAGTVKTVKAIYNQGQTNNNQMCPCLCTKGKWESMIDTPQCTNGCEGRDPQAITGKDSPIC